MAADFDATADELYARPPEEFVERRDTAAREAKADDPETAKAIRALKKPSTAAWLLNQLVRANRDDVAGLLDLGAALRQAQSRLEGAQLRELSKQRRLAVNALVREARQLAARLGKPASESVAREVEQSLEAALSSAEAAQAVESGRLTTALNPDAGFDSGAPHLHVVREKEQVGRRAAANSAAAKSTAASSTAAKSTAAKGAAAKKAASTQARAAAEALARAEKVAAQAAEELEAATAERDRAAAHVGDLTEQIADLTNQLRELEQQLTEAKRSERDARAALTAVERAARRAELAVESARGAVSDS
jgi:chromosome segregation ATPase